MYEENKCERETRPERGSKPRPRVRLTIKPGTLEHETMEHETLAEHRNTGATPEHWRNNKTLAEQSEYYRTAKQDNTSGTTEQQNNIKKYYQHRTTTY